MSKYIPGNQKHLSLEDRIYIENELNKGETFKNIARFLCKDPTTISKEVRAHRLSDWYHKGTFYNAHNFCIHRYHCKKKNYFIVHISIIGHENYVYKKKYTKKIPDITKCIINWCSSSSNYN